MNRRHLFALLGSTALAPMGQACPKSYVGGARRRLPTVYVTVDLETIVDRNRLI